MLARKIILGFGVPDREGYSIGGGLMLGGIFAFSGGCFHYWGDRPAGGRLLVLLVALGVLLWIGAQRLAELQPKSPGA